MIWKRGRTWLTVATATALFLGAVGLWLSSRVIVVEHPLHGRLRYHRILGRITRVDIDTRGTGRYDRELRWTFRHPLRPLGSSAGPYPAQEARDVNFDGQWDTWIHRGQGGVSVWAIDRDFDGKADSVRSVDDASLGAFNSEIEMGRGFGIGGNLAEPPQKPE
jgi:hypothetical protein